ncbi:tRNA (adenine(22)-N(1))-methyltransferase [Virgibacillus kekensis]|uniref:tRNA (Adenine(22)-N(1))-methyltransferase n=1 Tax=Virgibacillus kekensis TaxID=202261 RepID=A0ABV9DKC7_9BACI
MNNNVKLSDRLRKVASFITPGSYFADIGSDHAYLPCYVCMKDNEAHAIAGEVNRGPYESAIETVTQCNLSSRIDVRLGNGLSVLNVDDGIDSVVIAGMGGALIRSILEEGKAHLRNVSRIVAQPNVDERQLRKWLYTNDYTITEEEILEENGHIYEIIVADKNAERNPFKEGILDRQFLFGPILLHKKPQVFYRKWEHEAFKRERVIGEMKKASKQNPEKLSAFQQELQWIQEVLSNGRDYS